MDNVLRNGFGHVVFTGSRSHMDKRDLIEEAREARAILRGVNFGDFDLSGMNLSGMDLRYCHFHGKRLVGVDFSHADLSNANFTNAVFVDVKFNHANIQDTIFKGTRMQRVVGLDPRLANLAAIQDDLYRVLDHAPDEVPVLLHKLRAGKIDGTIYQGDCACLLGTIAQVRKQKHPEMRFFEDMKPVLEGIITNSESPIERWVFGITERDTPDNNPFARMLEQWILEWQAARGQGELIKNHPNNKKKGH